MHKQFILSVRTVVQMFTISSFICDPLGGKKLAGSQSKQPHEHGEHPQDTSTEATLRG